MPWMFSAGIGARESSAVAHHAVIAVRMVPRDKALVAPEPVHAIPRHPVAHRAARPAAGRAGAGSSRRTGKPRSGRGCRRRGRRSSAAARCASSLRHRLRPRCGLWSAASALLQDRRSARVADRGDRRAHNRGAWNTAEPATIAFAPASITCQAFSPLEPAIDLDDRVEPALVAQAPQRCRSSAASRAGISVRQSRD